jgi:hypothetical protein
MKKKKKESEMERASETPRYASDVMKIAEDINDIILSEITDEVGEAVCPSCDGPILSLDQIRRITGRSALSTKVRCSGCKSILGMHAFSDEVEIVTQGES